MCQVHVPPWAVQLSRLLVKVSCRVVEDAPAVALASDHFPLLAEFAFEEQR
ncbi:MAG: hypothetical protein L0332_08420 [Chloroflexi bacterium]|nr:hypothetical protein [Chloroflexota bacterium]MCI0575409.1 hypothetical protein [Chloroflexota bacterium]MCI0645465.1 hypothetical protein [Chloroflexota bacterium]MCI0726732.1 hypothetical protein [Chloroflexota bacterium]